MMTNCLPCFTRKTNHSSNNFITNKLLKCSNSFFIQLTYFLTLSSIGYLGLSLFSKPRSLTPHEFDLFFTSVSASTVSSMSTVEMETFSNFQLIILTLLMFLGGEVFTSFLGIQLRRLKFHSPQNPNSSELDTTISRVDLENDTNPCALKLKSTDCLGLVVLGYLLVVHICGCLCVYVYFSLFPSARIVLEAKGIKLTTFSVFSIVSSFSNCGFIPTNENMIVFKENSGLLLTLISQILLGNTLYPVFLRALISILGKITKRRELAYLLESSSNETGYDHLLSPTKSSLLALTSLGFVSAQLTLFCAMEWGSMAMNGLSLYQKFVASLFQVVNSRHAGESVFDISLVSPAILVVFVVMMYLPPYTLFQPKKDHKEKLSTNDDTKRKTVLECLMFSNLSYLAIFVVLICISERESMKNDPLNFNVLNVVIEVISAYGNVGFSTGYSCARRLNRESECRDMWYGFSGRWSSNGKLILIVVMFFGRLKKFNMKGGKAWKLV